MTVLVTDAVVVIDKTTVALWEYQGSECLGGWTRDDIETMVERVNRGAQLLDEDLQGWNYKVLPEKLELSSGTMCIVGQAYGTYGGNIGPIFARQQVEEYAQAQSGRDEDAIAEQYGFVTCDDGIPWGLMDRVWSYLIEERASKKTALTLAMPAREPQNIALQRLIDANLISDEALA